MNIRYLLPEHSIALNKLRVKTFLPDLVLAGFLVGLPAIFKLVQKPILAGVFRQGYDFSSSVAFEGLDATAQVRRLCNKMEMVIQENIGIEAETLVLAAE